MLCLALFGLYFYPALLLLAIFWVKAFRNDRYDFLIMISLFFGGYGMLNVNIFPVWTSDLALLLALVYWVILRKPRILKLTLLAIVLYFAFLGIFAYLSIEKITTQLLIMRNYFGIVYIIVPIALFAGKDFDIHVFFTKCMPYLLIMCAFYICDAIIIPGNILVPQTYMPYEATSTFYDPFILPLGTIYRKYPPGLFLLSLAVLPVARYYRLRLWQWALIGAALLASQTFTVIIGLATGVILFQGSWRKIARFFVLGVFGLVALYGIDCLLPDNDQKFNSTLRIKSSVDQFFDLAKAVDDEDLANFASGRVAQILPKVDLMISQNRTAIGLGFLHREKTTINRYIIYNEYYTDLANADEVATGVEVVPVQVFINIGYIGLIGHILFFVVLYLFIRKLKYSVYYLSVVYVVSVFGLSGFAGLATFTGLQLTSIAYGVIILANRDKLGWPKAARNSRSPIFPTPQTNAAAL